MTDKNFSQNIVLWKLHTEW